MSYQSDAVNQWRKNTKAKIIAGLGGKCMACGYDRCADALDLHHFNSNTKEFSIGKIMAHPVKWVTIVEECKKCVLLCANCHREYHSGIIRLDIKDEHRFDESRIPQSLFPNQLKMDKCPVCGTLKPHYSTTCSRKCAAHLSRKIDWDKIDLEYLLSQMSQTAVAKKLGVSDSAVFKRAKRLGIK